MKRRILLLGAGQLVGARIQAALAASDWADCLSYAAPVSALTGRDLLGVDAVFNATVGSPADIVGAARALYGILEKMGRHMRVVHLSSMTVYGSRTGVTAESAPLLADLGAYAAAQIEAEEWATRHPGTVVLRPGCEYGPDCPQWSGRIARLLLAHRLGDLGAAGDGVCNLLFIDDLVAAVLGSLQTAAIDGQCFNLAMASPPTWNDYLLRFARALAAVPVARVGRRRLNIETRLLAPPLKGLELLERRLRGRAYAVPPSITPSLLALCAQRITLDSRRAEQSLGLRWTPLDVGLRQAAAVYRSASVQR